MQRGQQRPADNAQQQRMDSLSEDSLQSGAEEDICHHTTRRQERRRVSTGSSGVQPLSQARQQQQTRQESWRVALVGCRSLC
jgi:hypothetical protein